MLATSAIQQFQWFDCPMVLRRDTNNLVEYVSMKPEVEIIDEDLTKQNLQVQITLQKNFNYNEQLGFSWHKSWIIPQLIINLKSFQDFQQFDGRILCEITSGYPTTKNNLYYLHEVRIDGEKSKRMLGNQIKFSNLKFTTTSFNKQGNKFSLIAILYLEEIGAVKIIKSLISVPIYIDSRKEARTKKETIIKMQEIIQPFRFEETIIIRRKSQEIVIENDINGFMEYYSAANIRNKIKHPFFVCHKFSRCFSLYYNTKEVKKQANVATVLLNGINNQKKNLVILYTPYVNHELKKRVSSIFDNWRIGFLQLFFDKELIPKCFAQFASQNILKEYQPYYKKNSKSKEKEKEKEVNSQSTSPPFKEWISSEFVLQNTRTQNVKLELL